uniref:SEP domain-containing protein n=1 Tax=Panagrellus redivivus TaxID=6233 RepID=A0A7E4VYH6_PANRE
MSSMTRQTLFEVLASLGTDSGHVSMASSVSSPSSSMPSTPSFASSSSLSSPAPSLMSDAHIMAQIQASFHAGMAVQGMPNLMPMMPSAHDVASLSSIMQADSDGSATGGKLTKRRINRGRAFKAHRGVYNVVLNGKILTADLAPNVLREELTKKQQGLPAVLVKGVNVFEKLAKSIDLLPHLNNPSHCGAIVAGHLYPRDFFISHILRDADGNVKAAKGFINHSNREPLSRTASQIFFDVLYYFGGVIIDPTMLESWLWVARKGVNDRGNTSKSGRGVRYFVNKDYKPIIEYDYWTPETLLSAASSSASLAPTTADSSLSSSGSTVAGLLKLPEAYLPAAVTAGKLPTVQNVIQNQDQQHAYAANLL